MPFHIMHFWGKFLRQCGCYVFSVFLFRRTLTPPRFLFGGVPFRSPLVKISFLSWLRAWVCDFFWFALWIFFPCFLQEPTDRCSATPIGSCPCHEKNFSPVLFLFLGGHFTPLPFDPVSVFQTLEATQRLMFILFLDLSLVGPLFVLSSVDLTYGNDL